MPVSNAAPQRRVTALLLNYTPRRDVDLGEYHAWLQQVDNPFFNSRPAVRRYVNWRIVAPKIGTPDYTHFDLLEIEGDGGFESVFGDEKIAEFARNWVRLWGNVPDPDAPDQSVNYHVYVVDQIAAPPAGA